MPSPETGGADPEGDQSSTPGQQPEYSRVIEENFETSGPNIGRTKNTELAVDMARDERRSLSDDRQGRDDWVSKAGLEDDRKRKELLAVRGADPEYAELKPTDDPEELEKGDRIKARIDSDYERLQQAQRDHDAKLLADARDREIRGSQGQQ